MVKRFFKKNNVFHDKKVVWMWFSAIILIASFTSFYFTEQGQWKIDWFKGISYIVFVILLMGIILMTARTSKALALMSLKLDFIRYRAAACEEAQLKRFYKRQLDMICEVNENKSLSDEEKVKVTKKIFKG